MLDQGSYKIRLGVVQRLLIMQARDLSNASDLNTGVGTVTYVPAPADAPTSGS